MYIQVDVSIAEHPKLKKLARTLGISRPAAIGHLTALWSWAARFAPDGDLTAYLTDPDTLADAAMWDGDSQTFVDALIAARFGDDSVGFLEVTVDGALLIHDWADFFGKVLEKRLSNAERMRTARASEHPERSAAEPKDARAATPDARAATPIAPDPDPARTCDARASHAERTCALNVNVTQRNVNDNGNGEKRNDDGVARAREAGAGSPRPPPIPSKDPAAAAVFSDLAPQQLAALSFLLTAAPTFANPVDFVRRNNPKLVAYWSLHITSQPYERLQTVGNIGGLIAKYVKAGKFPDLKPDVRRQYDEMADRFLNQSDDPDIVAFIARLTGDAQ